MIHFYSEDCRFPLKEKAKIKNWLIQIAVAENKLFQRLNIIFVSDEYELILNQSFLKHDYYTDIITFDYSDQKEIIIGEMYISGDRVKENASKFKIKLFDEALRVMAHGLLHLCGYEDYSVSDKQIMRGKEDYYLSLY